MKAASGDQITCSYSFLSFLRVRFVSFSKFLFFFLSSLLQFDLHGETRRRRRKEEGRKAQHQPDQEKEEEEEEKSLFLSFSFSFSVGLTIEEAHFPLHLRRLPLAGEEKKAAAVPPCKVNTLTKLTHKTTDLLQGVVVVLGVVVAVVLAVATPVTVIVVDSTTACLCCYSLNLIRVPTTTMAAGSISVPSAKSH